MLLLEVEVEAGRQHERGSAAAELTHEARLVGLLVGRQLARPVEYAPAPRAGAAVLPAVEPAARACAGGNGNRNEDEMFAVVFDARWGLGQGAFVVHGAGRTPIRQAGCVRRTGSVSRRE